MKNQFRIAATLTTALTVTLFSSSKALAEEPAPDTSVPAPARSEPAVPTTSEAATSRFHADAEVDPTAYVFDGYSLHLGLGYGRARLDWGAFAQDIPKFVHRSDGFEASAHGFGAKFQYFLFAEQRGPFAGVDGAVQRTLIEREGTDLAKELVGIRVGVHAGYRIALPANFYVTPWLGVSYGFGAHDVELGGATYKNTPVLLFPAIHLGYRFQ